MSELKAFNSERIYWAVEQVERVAGDIDELHLDDNMFYLKSEADKLIAELNMRICDSDEDFEIANNQIERLLKIVRHQKYKRCLVMAEQCKESMRLMRTYEATDDYWDPELGHDAEYFFKKGDFYKKWRKRWLKIAEKFNEAK